MVGPFSLALVAVSIAVAAPRVAWQSKFGGNGQDRVTAAATDSFGNILVVGETTSRDFPATTLQTRPGGSSLTLDGKPVDIPLSGDVKKILTDRRNLSVTHVLTTTGLLKTTDSAQTWKILYNGLIDDFAVNPANSNVVYLAAAGKVLKTSDGGLSWNPAGDAGPSPVSTVFIDNFSPSLTIDPYHPDTVYWNGLYRSVDGGATWTVLASYAGKLIFDPLRAGVAYRYDFAGLERSIDGGQNWDPIEPPSPIWLGKTSHLLIDPNRAGYLYAIKYLPCQGTPGPIDQTLSRPGLYNPFCNDTRIYRSADDGANWTQVGIFGFFFALGGQPGLAAVYAHDGNNLVRSIDGFKTFTTIANIPRRNISSFGFTATGGVLMGSNASTDLFAAKLDPQGKMLWSTYIGGDNYEIAGGIAAGSDGSVYVTGVSYSTSFGISPDTGSRAAFVTRILPDGKQMVFSKAVAQGFTTPVAIAVDRDGAAYIAGRTLDTLPSTPGAFQHDLSLNLGNNQQAIAENGFVMKLDPAGGVVYATFLGDAGMTAASIAVDDAGTAYVGGSALWKLSASGSLLLGAAFLDGMYFTNVAFDARRGLYASASSSAGNTLMKFDGSTMTMVNSKQVSDDGVLFAQSLAVDSSGNAFLGGKTNGVGVATRGLIEGAGRDGGGFLIKTNADGTSLVYSTYLLADVTALTLGADGNPVVLSAPFSLTKYDEGAPALALRLDAVLDAANLESTPVVTAAKLALTGPGVAAPDTAVFMNDVRIKAPSVVNGALVFEAPAAAVNPVVRVERSGLRSQDVKLASAGSSPSVFSSDGSGKGFALAFNEDGSANSAQVAATSGTMLTIVANGLNPRNALTILVDGAPCAIVATQRTAVDGLPGANDTVTIQLPSDIPGGHHLLQIYDETSLYVKPGRVFFMVQ